ncbi:MAG: ABC transporter transmembrane domain-containing protein [Christensenellales bacterium]
MAGFIFLYAMLVIVQVATIYAFLYLGGVIEVGVCYNIRQEAFHKLQELPFSSDHRMPVGYLMSRMTSDIQRLAEPSAGACWICSGA